MSGTLKRCHLLTNKDLYNIERSFNLNNETCRHSNDAISLDPWMKEIDNTGCVLFYKAQEECCNKYPLLKKDDFALIIMNQGQLEMLDRYGDDCICIDETFGLNMYGFNLTTILILDDMREGFPCAFLISNRSDEHMMQIFFKSVKDRLERSLKPKVFMAPVFYNAWIMVMEMPLHRLYCAWHLDRAWRTNLITIISREKQVAVYKKLRTLLQETDKNAFSTMISAFLTNLSEDQDTTDFANYFEKYYTQNIASWAYCYRMDTGINTNMHIENMHRSIKYIYLNGKINKRLDYAIYILMKFVRDKLFNRLIVLNKGKVSSKLKELRIRHKTSETLNVSSVIVNKNGWVIPSSSTNDLYQIEERQIDCNCKLVCSQCQNKYIHRYTCSCLDSSIKWNMCKHIYTFYAGF
ncbi:uncharacterized protein LOC126746925 [Anthonomus grandis grandis]|uniref:uncharacterized protein LOC126746925 n=1 Tax=Anthonomus grandis grandis TaxID=2921223 RepID=UPI002166049E|nr:uncharacterized protein LOC126746925 [Anthonomus grandis grandis]